ncbi:ABC transporter ATP-binding protein [Streptomyces sp. XD-27]|uniref:ABC transporter ATP-binding protein n=1 Tax=Streptomyces sp. XD-27 TaxID=3062779 RepID=UPI0026F442E6|nr:ABC transporter ATP-binding protein [Streptomyces sp. XD-27]WKX69324.1 ABC transporter ATP-binding protein [Streptomyces sp. XD-27]
MTASGVADRPTGAAGGSENPVLALWGRTHGFRAALAGLVILELLSNAAVLVEPLVVIWVLDALQDDGDLSTPVLTLGGIAVVGVALAAVTVFLLGRLGQRLVLRIRQETADRILDGQVTEVERLPTGDLLSRVGSDTTLLQQTLTEALVRGAVAPLALLAALALMATINGLLALVLVALLACATAVEWWAIGRHFEAAEDTQNRIGRMLTALQRVLIAFRTVKASATQPDERRRINGEAAAAYRSGVRTAKWAAVVDAVGLGTMEMLFLVALGIGSFQVSSGQLTLSGLVAFLLYAMYLREPVERLTEAAPSISSGLAAVQRLEQIRKLPVESALEDGEGARTDGTPSGHRRDKPGAGSVVLEDVWFGYDSTDVIKGLSLNLGRGLTVLAGPSGAGKTTVLSLIERFVDADRGRIRFDGVDIRHFHRGDLRRRLAYVEQESPLLGSTLRQAVLYGASDAGDAEVAAVLSAVGLDDWVGSLPQGLDTPLGERGVTISGGQRQRLAVARALLRQAEVLLLDEATSQLDGRSERVLLRTIVENARARTVVAVTQRLSLAAHAERVVVLDDGRIRAVGTHQELLSTDPLYRALAASDDHVPPSTRSA